MLNRILIDSKNKLRYGSLCESLIFYQTTILLIDYGSLPEFLTRAGYEVIEELVQSGDLEIRINETSLGSGHVGGNKYLISAFSAEKITKENTIKHAIEKVYGKHKNFDQIYGVLDKNLHTHRYSEAYLQQLNDELSNASNIIAALELLTGNPLDANQINIQIQKTKEGFYQIDSSIDNERIRDAAFLILTGTGEMHNGATFNSSLSIQPDSSKYCEYKMKTLVEKSMQQQDQIKLFHKVVLKDQIDLKSTMAAEYKHFQEFIDVWRVSRKFKEWASKQEPSAELLQEYFAKVREVSWLEKLPPKVLRFSFFTGAGQLIDMLGAGGIGKAAGIGLGLFDDFLLDMIFKKWKPDQFIEGEYKDFLEPVPDIQ